jgi:DNA-binding NarL/FixJ family response regulator
MFDGSSLPLSENLALAGRLLDDASRVDIVLELEIGVVGGEEDGLPGKGGVELIPDLLAVSPLSRVLMLSSNAEPGTVEKALAAGATGYSIKRATDVELVAAVQAVAGGTAYVHPEVGASMAGAGRQRPGPLSPRELDVLRLVALGHTNQEIARELYISTRTIEMHRASIMRKLHFDTRAQLVNYALANGLIGPT